ncbi:uncharacterized protein PHACADRAFT_249884 [Phanerochaete carnosa HHB-10118-sp]|uniref:Uncharacterized protein n=1 Tax=Phanerochaete carnosa (strain HHB-10118-sp) TaxID=650164 RepID=K5WJW0_PHACS|nr:uncharacterized protein PHACADRAFT_249884 [Phanerochaete carnosa HHB-10118-sp]EKM59414.1 hypothetical protein PHACADRAFT_249884 [Phanerochaete carnosa HHB-10118-sp]
MMPRMHNGVSHPLARGLLGDGGGPLGLGGDSTTSSDSGLLGLSIPALPTLSLSLPGIPDIFGSTSSSSSSSSATTASTTSSSQTR